MADLDLDAIAAIEVEWDGYADYAWVTLTVPERDALVAEVRRLRVIETGHAPGRCQTLSAGPITTTGNAPRLHPLGGYVIEVAAADHLESVEARLAEVTAERDRLAAAIKAIPRHRRGNDPCTYGACMVCAAPWPCPTENVRAALAALDGTP